MTKAPDPNWQPDPQLLAAYFDGELEGRDDVADLRRRIEAWLQKNPQARADWQAHQQLRRLWLDTTPADPRSQDWQRTRRDIDRERQRRAALPTSRPWWTAGIAAACVLILISLTVVAWRNYSSVVRSPQPLVQQPLNEENVEVLQVASADEITILRIEDADSASVVVGTFPVSGELDFALAGEVCISCKCPRVVVRQDPPMVYAVADAK